MCTSLSEAAPHQKRLRSNQGEMGDVKRGAVEGRAPPSEVVEPYNAVVFGSTGAVGKEVVKALAESDKCTSVVAVVRQVIDGLCLHHAALHMW